jgi:hypothetical protein
MAATAHALSVATWIAVGRGENAVIALVIARISRTFMWNVRSSGVQIPRAPWQSSVKAPHPYSDASVQMVMDGAGGRNGADCDSQSTLSQVARDLNRELVRALGSLGWSSAGVVVLRLG